VVYYESQRVTLEVGVRLYKIFLALLYIGIPLGIAGACYAMLRFYALEPRDLNATQPVVFDAETTKTFLGIAQNLEQQGLIRSSLAFRAIARLQKKDMLIKAGEYSLSASMTPQEILDKMVRGEMIQYRTTIKEGMTIREIGNALEDAGIIESRLLLDTAFNPDVARDEGISGPSLEGYLFPETYNFRRNTPARKILSVMHEEFKKRWQPEWTQRAEILGMSTHQIVTLASIVEKESGNFEEQPIISSVFHNRLKKGMRLQADPTVIYGIKDFNGNITKLDLVTETPYNTYTIDGLPPGPISNPGSSAIKAALYPADTQFLYFVGNGAGRHIFSENLDRHNDAVNLFQRGRSRALADSRTTAPNTPPASSEGNETANEHAPQP
jgi:UPF0755 protein